MIVEDGELDGREVEALAGLANKISDVEMGLREVWGRGLPRGGP